MWRDFIDFNGLTLLELYLFRRTYNKYWGSTLLCRTPSRKMKMDSCLVLTEYFSRWILCFPTSAFDLIHPERVSTWTSSFFAHRLFTCIHNNKIEFSNFCVLSFEMLSWNLVYEFVLKWFRPNSPLATFDLFYRVILFCIWGFLSCTLLKKIFHLLRYWLKNLVYESAST